MSTIVLTEGELRKCVALDLNAIDVVEEAFIAMAHGGSITPPILRLEISDRNAEVDVKTAYLRGRTHFAIKVSSGFFDNSRLNLPSLSGLIVLLSAETGRVAAVLLDNGYLTDIRTAAAGAVAARHLAPRQARSAGVIGAGVQARLQIHALNLVRPITHLYAWARDPRKAEQYASEVRQSLPIVVTVCSEPRDVVDAADVIVTTTPAKSPIIRAEWLHAGQHITAMGSDAEDKNELAPAALRLADLYVCDHVAQCARLGELHHAIEAGLIPEDENPRTLGAVAAGITPGRESETQITICDLTGTGAQDTAIADFAFRAAIERGYGTTIS